MRDLMVDIETLGGGLDPVIVQIGACYFSTQTGEVGDKFKENITIQECLDFGFQVDGSTIEFWLKQMNRSFLVGPKSVVEVLCSFSSFSSKVERAWAHATFDFPILFNAYKKLGLRIPFSYKAMRDIRTLVDLSGVALPKVPESTKTHDALDDCLYQVSYCTLCFKALANKGVKLR